MSNSKFNLDTAEALELAESGMSFKQAAGMMEISEQLLRKRIKQIEEEDGIILDFQKVESKLLTKVKGMALNEIANSIEAGRFETKDLAKLYETLAKQSQLKDGKPTELKGLVGVLIELEQEDAEREAIDISNNSKVLS